MNKSIDTTFEILDLVKLNFPLLYNCNNSFEISMLKYSENYTFLVNLENDKKIIRVNRPNYHTFEELNSEVVWMDMLKKNTDLIIPKVIAGKNNELIQNFKSYVSGITYYCSLFSFMDGTIVRNLKEDELLEKMCSIGEMTAKLHIFSMENDIKLERFEWNYETLFCDNPRWGDWREYKGLTLNDFSTIKATLSIIENRLKKYGKDIFKYGLIHSDLHLSNVIMNNDILQLIDFDDCGYGWYMYELGCTLVEYSENLDELIKAWVEGYEKVRTLSIEEKDEFNTFIIMRRIARLAWLSSHSDSDTAKNINDNYLTKTIELCEDYIITNS